MGDSAPAVTLGPGFRPPDAARRVSGQPADAARTAAGRRGGRGGAVANHRFARLRSAPAVTPGPGFRPPDAARRVSGQPADAARTAAGRRGGRGGAVANHRFARLRSAPAVTPGPGFRPPDAARRVSGQPADAARTAAGRRGGRGGAVANHRFARLRSAPAVTPGPGFRLPDAARRVSGQPADAARTAAGRRGGRGGAVANHRFARLRSAPAVTPGPGFRPPDAARRVSGQPADAARTATGRRGGSIPLPSVSAASPTPRSASACHRPGSR